MKNIQIIDGAQNCVYDIFAATPEQFALIFPQDGQDIAFIDEVYEAGDKARLDAAFADLWTRRLEKKDASGIHGTLFYDLPDKKQYYPTRRDSDATRLKAR